MANNLDLNNIPAMAPPPGATSNLTSNLYLDDLFYIIKKIELADFIPIFACVGTVIYIALSVTDLTLGAGKHAWNISATKAMQLGYMTNVIAVVYAPVIVLAKCSVIIPLTRTFTPNGKTWLYWSYFSLLGLNVGFYFSGMVTIIFACTPREKIWNPQLPGTCINQNMGWLLGGAWNVFTDFAIIVLPLFSIWHLRLGIKYKIGISIMFLTTVFALFASIARTYYTIKLVTMDDLTFVYAELGLWTTAEIASLICCSCMPVFPRLYHWLRGNSSRTAKSDQVEFVHRRKQKDAILNDKSLGPSYNTQVLVSTQEMEG